MRDQTLWTWHVAAGLVILVLLGLHMTVMHLDTLVGIGNVAGGHSIDWANVLERMRSGALTVSYVLLLGAALFHGFYGLRNIIYEFGPSREVKAAVNGLLWICGLALFVFGTWAAWQSHQIAAGA